MKGRPIEKVPIFQALRIDGAQHVTETSFLETTSCLSRHHPNIVSSCVDKDTGHFTLVPATPVSIPEKVLKQFHAHIPFNQFWVQRILFFAREILEKQHVGSILTYRFMGQVVQSS